MLLSITVSLGPNDGAQQSVTGHHQPSNDQSHRNNIITLPSSGVKKLCIAAVDEEVKSRYIGDLSMLFFV